MADLLFSEVALLRIGLVGAGALFLQTAIQVATSAPLADAPIYTFVVIALGILGLAVLVASGWRTLSRQWKWLILLAVVSEIVLTTAIWRQTQRLHPTWRVDVNLYIDMASELIQRGENPYAWDFNGVPEMYRATQAATTPQLEGSICERSMYPALSFISVLPFEVVGLPGVWLVPVLAQIAAACLLFLAAPRNIQPVILLPMVVWFHFSDLTAVGANDIVWAAFITGMIVAWRRPALRALLYGLAISYKQFPWFLFPFVAVRIWRGSDHDTPRRLRLARLVYFVSISGLTFSLFNLPFIFWDPIGWIKGVMTPMTGTLIYLSHGGLSGLTAFGYINLPKNYYLLVMLTVLALLLFIYWRHYAMLRDTFVIWPAILIWFSHRALVSYWIYWTLPTLGILIQRSPPVTVPPTKPRWVYTALVSVAVVIALVAAGVFMTGETPILVEAIPPYWTMDGNVYHLTMRVQNRSDDAIWPRFGVHFDYTGFSPLPWHIESGPLVLEPGQSALYQIASNGGLTFPAHTPAQVVVTDAGGNYALRGVATIGPDRSFLWPDAIQNPEFLFWDSNTTAPISWRLRAEPAGTGTASYAERDLHSTVMLAFDEQSPGPKSVSLYSFILIPRTPFGIWVYPDVALESRAQYGIEFEDGERRLTLRFGTHDHVDRVSDQHVIIERPVPVHRWTYQEIDLSSLYQQAGWDLPSSRPLVYRNVDADFRAVDMSLFLTSDGTADDARVYFGPLKQDSFQVKPEILMAETLNDPVGYYVRLSERYASERNYARALLVIERAQELAPGDAAISVRIDEIKALLRMEKPQ